MKGQFDICSRNTNNEAKSNYVPKSTTQLILNINESNRKMSLPHQQHQMPPTTSETLVLQEIQEMKEILLQVVKSNSSLNPNDAILHHLQNTVKKLNEKVNDLSESLQSISTDVAKLQNSNTKGNDLNKADISKSINYLNKHIKDLAPKSENLEAQLRVILIILRGLLESNPSKSLRIGKIESHLKFIYSVLKRQGSTDKPIFAEIKEVLGLLKQSKEPGRQSISPNITEGDIVGNEDSQIESYKLNRNYNNDSIQSSNAVQQAPEMKGLITQMVGEMEYLQPEESPNCFLSDEVTCPMKAIPNILQTVRATENPPEIFPELQKNSNLEVCKQDISVNQSNDVNNFNPTPELLSAMDKIKSYIEQIQPQIKFEETDALNTLLFAVKCIKKFVKCNKGDFKIMQEILALLKKVECELCKQEGTVGLLLREIINLRKQMEDLYKCSPPRSPRKRGLKVDASLSISEKSRGIKETKILKCLIHHLKKFIKQYNDGIQYPESDFFNHVKLVLDAMITITRSKKIDEGYKNQLPKILQCLEVELDKQKDGKQLVKKLNQIRVNLGLKSPKADPHKVLCRLLHYLKKLVRKTRPDIEIPHTDKVTLISFFLDTLMDATQSGEFNPETLGKLLKVLQCIRYCLCENGQQTPDLKTKLQDILQLITNRGNVLTQDEQNIPTTSDAENAQVEEGKRDSQI